jgi:hypothetical protein
MGPREGSKVGLSKARECCVASKNTIKRGLRDRGPQDVGVANLWSRKESLKKNGWSFSKKGVGCQDEGRLPMVSEDGAGHGNRGAGGRCVG